jgi:chitinase
MAGRIASLVAVLCLVALVFSAAPASAQCAAGWAPNTSYSVNTQASYSGRNYRCQQAHTSLVGWEPPNAPALWLRL